ncbi:helix-turn-helix domain-containing protein [Nocardioides fonticola]|uniref:Helix-turn-helix domain-containing protein n=1 Tax=Nocardioides fonticola TaxID=450363 RepID=A0ABP7Y2A4_9ACTN
MTTLRVQRLAALAEPTRLEVADRLALGDASPSELATALGLPSNLLAHHLAVLEECGLVTRHRSHADRRRTYLRLDAGALGGLLPLTQPAPTGTPARRVVFVCTGNSARSQIAAAAWRRSSSLPVASGGTRPAACIAPGAVAAARRHRLDLTASAPRGLGGLLTDGDFVVTVCDAAHEDAAALAAHAEGHHLAGTSHWSVPDPVPVGTDAAFDAAVEEITARVADLAVRLDPSPTHPTSRHGDTA